jgi:hypothetical protein
LLRFAVDIAIIAQDEINVKGALEWLDTILKSNYKMKIKGHPITGHQGHRGGLEV